MTATLPPVSDVRGCRLYRFYGWDPRTGYTTKTLIYIGETVRQPFDRLMEHVSRQPWADTITSWEVDDEVFPGKTEVLAAEKAAVEADKPLYNDEWNHGNPDRVELSDQERQRWARDAAARRPPWRRPQHRPMYRHGVPVDPPHPRQPAWTVSDRQAPASRKWSPAQVKTGLWSLSWLLTTVVGWGELERHGAWPALTNILCASAASVLPLVWSLAGAPLTRRQWRKVRRRGWKRWMR